MLFTESLSDPLTILLLVQREELFRGSWACDCAHCKKMATFMLFGIIQACVNVLVSLTDLRRDKKLTLWAWIVIVLCGGEICQFNWQVKNESLQEENAPS